MEAINWSGVKGIIVRHLFTWRRDLDRVVDAFWWATVDLIFWGLTSKYIEQYNTGIDIVAVFIGGIIFWSVIIGSQRVRNCATALPKAKSHETSHLRRALRMWSRVRASQPCPSAELPPRRAGTFRVDPARYAPAGKGAAPDRRAPRALGAGLWWTPEFTPTPFTVTASGGSVSDGTRVPPGAYPPHRAPRESHYERGHVAAIEGRSLRTRRPLRRARSMRNVIAALARKGIGGRGGVPIHRGEGRNDGCRRASAVPEAPG